MIDAVRELRASRGSPDGPAHLTLHVSVEPTHLMGNRDLQNELEAKSSLFYEAAVVWTDARVTPPAFERNAVAGRLYQPAMGAIEIVSSIRSAGTRWQRRPSMTVGRALPWATKGRGFGYYLSSTDTIIRPPALNGPSSQSALPRRRKVGPAGYGCDP
jgi:hypothetical protein